MGHNPAAVARRGHPRLATEPRAGRPRGAPIGWRVSPGPAPAPGQRPTSARSCCPLRATPGTHVPGARPCLALAQERRLGEGRRGGRHGFHAVDHTRDCIYTNVHLHPKCPWWPCLVWGISGGLLVRCVVGRGRRGEKERRAEGPCTQQQPLTFPGVGHVFQARLSPLRVVPQGAAVPERGFIRAGPRRLRPAPRRCSRRLAQGGAPLSAGPPEPRGPRGGATPRPGLGEGLTIAFSH